MARIRFTECSHDGFCFTTLLRSQITQHILATKKCDIMANVADIAASGDLKYLEWLISNSFSFLLQL